MASTILKSMHRSCPFTGLSHCFCPEGVYSKTSDTSASSHQVSTNEISQCDLNQGVVPYSNFQQYGLENMGNMAKASPGRHHLDEPPPNPFVMSDSTSIKYTFASKWLQSFGYSTQDASSLFHPQAKSCETTEGCLIAPDKGNQSQHSPLPSDAVRGFPPISPGVEYTKNEEDIAASPSLSSSLSTENIGLYNSISNAIFQERYAYLLKTIPIEYPHPKAQPVVTSQEEGFLVVDKFVGTFLFQMITVVIFLSYETVTSEALSPQISLVASTPFSERGNLMEDWKSTNRTLSTATFSEEVKGSSLPSTGDSVSAVHSVLPLTSSRSNLVSNSATVAFSSIASPPALNEEGKHLPEVRKQPVRDEEHLKSISEKYGASVLLAGEQDDDDLRIELICHVRSCNNDSDKKELLLCIKCRRSFHAGCCSPPLKYELVTRHTWSCNECKACKICGSNTNEETMLICDACDRAFHMECLTPPVHEVPDGEWFCTECGQCHCCSRIFTRQEALDPFGCFNGRYRLCITCKDRYGSRSSSKRLKTRNKAEDEEINELCCICVKRLISVDKGEDLGPVVKCKICFQEVHKTCCHSDNRPKEAYICTGCYEFQKGFGIMPS
ncbi:PHD-finger domain-containing protein [Cardiosporidium cionae]|uniref:PHD-finger domain-containing protein n=1 Tax=Cardiosporidium cionae TaxID=476202 RepID=A0ABQ7J829_9APIC|nr:PHD-finger domain-containing protein [Cardiosporidium cionae]|eukprot:KAF8820148.1 PHD-finger domain-containing protein [Cardiosporidium cionae]